MEVYHRYFFVEIICHALIFRHQKQIVTSIIEVFKQHATDPNYSLADMLLLDKQKWY